MYSEECLSFLPRCLAGVPVATHFLRSRRGRSIDFSRGHWTPPLGPAAAFRLERKQIANLGLRAMVSITDHDDMQAGAALQLTADNAEAPVSVEWTVPFGKSILHLGIHNLAPLSARAWLSAMQAYTAAPSGASLAGLLHGMSRLPETLVVLNHPFWLEEGVAEFDHRCALARFLRNYLPWIHAFELNGTRTRSENAAVVNLAREHGRSLVSGGDRHACEPSACINLTNAASFSEFAAEVREGLSEVLFMPQYREPLPLRLMEMCWDVLRPYPGSAGRERWIDRVFYRGDDGLARSLAEIWQGETPWPLRIVTGALQALTAAKPQLAALLQEREEAFL
jgi:predicted metal-dependent phosphoesterase TrpH